VDRRAASWGWSKKSNQLRIRTRAAKHAEKEPGKGAQKKQLTRCSTPEITLKNRQTWERTAAKVHVNGS